MNPSFDTPESQNLLQIKIYMTYACTGARGFSLKAYKRGGDRKTGVLGRAYFMGIRVSFVMSEK